MGFNRKSSKYLSMRRDNFQTTRSSKISNEEIRRYIKAVINYILTK